MNRSLFAAPILLGALLLFLIQPLVGKITTMQFGGVAQIWTACLLFFQMVLLAGYLISLELSKLKLKYQPWVFSAMVLLSLFFVGIPERRLWGMEDPNDNPLISLLMQLFAAVGPPCIVLATISTTFQNWYRVTNPSHNPYILYSVSNVGSFAALFGYPLVFEKYFTIHGSSVVWQLAYVALSILLLLAAWLVARQLGRPKSPDLLPPADQTQTEAPSTWQLLVWLYLSATGCMLFMVFTTKITMDLAPIPLLWILPLAIYLLSFMICFNGQQRYQPAIIVFLMFVAVIEANSDFVNIGALFGDAILYQIVSQLILLLLLCLFLHGELYESRPHPKHLPMFYMVLSLGGVVGGVLINVIFPLVFSSVPDYHLLLLMTFCLAFWVIANRNYQFFPFKMVHMLFVCGVFVFVVMSSIQAFFFQARGIVYADRNFYGHIRVEDHPEENVRVLANGSTVHGVQAYIGSTDQLSDEKVSYYSEHSAVDYVFRYFHERDVPLSAGIVGLGTGGIAAHGRKGDTLRFWELDPKIALLASSHFTFLKLADAEIEVVLGDGRQSLSHEKETRYEILVIDAFNSDSVPTHLLTKEFIQLALRHLEKDGVLAIHISNRYIDLFPVLEAIGNELQIDTLRFSTRFDKPSMKKMTSLYTLMTNNSDFVTHLRQSVKHKLEGVTLTLDETPNVPADKVWTDDYSDLFSAMMSQ